MPIGQLDTIAWAAGRRDSIGVPIAWQQYSNCRIQEMQCSVSDYETPFLVDGRA